MYNSNCTKSLISTLNEEYEGMSAVNSREYVYKINVGENMKIIERNFSKNKALYYEGYFYYSNNRKYCRKWENSNNHNEIDIYIYKEDLEFCEKDLE